MSKIPNFDFMLYDRMSIEYDTASDPGIRPNMHAVAHECGVANHGSNADGGLGRYHCGQLHLGCGHLFASTMIISSRREYFPVEIDDRGQGAQDLKRVKLLVWLGIVVYENKIVPACQHGYIRNAARVTPKTKN